MKKKYLFLVLIIFLSVLQSKAESRITAIFLDKKDVFDSTSNDWFFGAKILNALHTTTKSYIIEDELLFNIDEEIDEDLIYETERNLRRKGIFTNVVISYDSTGINEYALTVHTQDRWTLNPAVLFGSGGGESNLGAKIEDMNLFGTATYLSFSALHRSENNIGMQLAGYLSNERIFRTNLSLELFVEANKYRTNQDFMLYKKFLNYADTRAYGIGIKNYFGQNFAYQRFSDSTELLDFKEQKLNLWFSNAWLKDDKVFISILASLQKVNRGKNEFKQAYDNSGAFLVSFSSVAEEFSTVNHIDAFMTEDLATGGYGSATLGKIFPLKNSESDIQGESYYYVAGVGEQSYFDEKNYVLFRISAASAFSKSFAKNTYQDFLTFGFHKFDETTLLSARLFQQTVWNWDALRQLILDSEYGLRGYQLNNKTGDNRLISNIELRKYFNYNLWIFQLGATAFWDIGSVWNQGMSVSQSKFYNAAGLGLRLYNNKGFGNGKCLRVDFAWNFEKGSFGGVIITTDQLFTLIGSHAYRLPSLLGLNYDNE